MTAPTNTVKHPLFVLTNVTLARHGQQLTPYNVVIENGLITEVSQQAPSHLLLQREDVNLIDAQGHVLSAGLIDAQINGALGCNFNQCSTRQLKETLKILPQFGITSILPTIITAPLEDMLAAIQTVEESIRLWEPGMCRIAGIHLEGPFLNPDYHGIHPKASMNPRVINAETLRQLISPHTKLITLAPEMVLDHGFIAQLTEQGITVFAGHTGATSPQMTEAIEQGLSGVTHLFNAMKPFHHRAPGVISTALTHPKLTASIIVDGVHVYPEALRLVFHAKTQDTLMLVSDAMQLAGTPNGTQAQFAGQTITHTDGKAVGPQGELAGSACMLPNCVQNASDWHLASFAQALHMATETPANVLNLPDIGRIAPGHVADLTLWDKTHHTVLATWLQGQLVAYNGKTALPGLPKAGNTLGKATQQLSA